MKTKTPTDVARDIILSHGYDIEYLSIGEMIDNYIQTGYLPQMTPAEFEDFQETVDELICNSSLEVRFE